MADDPNQLSQISTNSIWKAGFGEGFRKGVQNLGLSVGDGLGLRVLGSSHEHYMALGFLQSGWIVTDVLGEDRWYRGNLELKLDIFGGEQYHPSTAYIVGGGPMLRYDFAPGGRCVPFFNAGAGVTATDIRDDDLSTTFEFNLQAGAGLHIFFCDNLALTLEYRFIHFSNAHISEPNLGVNANTGLIGVTWFF